MTTLLVAAAVPVYLLSYVAAYWQFLAIGFLLGIVGASFAVGTPYCARFFPREKRGFAMGFFGAGTTGAALNMFIALYRAKVNRSLRLAEGAEGLRSRVARDGGDEIVAAANVDTIKKYGPDRVCGFSPIPASGRLLKHPDLGCPIEPFPFVDAFCAESRLPQRLPDLSPNSLL